MIDNADDHYADDDGADHHNDDNASDLDNNEDEQIDVYHAHLGTRIANSDFEFYLHISSSMRGQR